MPSSSHGSRSRNRLLSVFDSAAIAERYASLEPVELPQNRELIRADAPIERVFFPATAVASVISTMENGDQFEVGTIGNEGVVGVSIFLGVDRIPNTVIVQIPGEGFVMSASDFRTATHENHAFRDIVARYAQVFLNQVAQTAACNRAHPLNERTARWLLMTHDRAGTEELPLTHEFLSYMLGVRRSSVTLALGALQQSGIISSRRGIIHILDREALEACSCECYVIVRDEHDRILRNS